MKHWHKLFVASLLAIGFAATAWAQTPMGTLHCNDADGNSNDLGAVLTVKGVITANQPTGTNNRLYIQDATGGLNVFGAPQDCALALGDEIEVTGTIGQFRGLNEIMSTGAAPLVITLISTGNPDPAPVVLTPTQVNATFQADMCEPLESSLIQVMSVFVRNADGTIPTGNYAANTNYRLISAGPDSATNNCVMRVVQSNNACTITNPLVGTPINPECPTTVTAVLSQFSSSSAGPHIDGYQLLVRGPDDLVVDCATPTRQSSWGRIKSIYR